MEEFFTKIFFNIDDNFNATTLTAIIAGFALIINIWLASKNHKANIISKSRIDWIDKVRSISADIISILYDFKKSKNIDYEKKNLLLKNAELLKLYFSSSNRKDNSSNLDDDLLEQLLMKTKNNSGKNYYIRKFIDDLVNASLSDSYTNYNSLINTYEIDKSEGYDKLYKLDVPIVEMQYCEYADEEIKTVVGREIPPYHEELASDILKEIQDINSKIKELKTNNKKTDKMIKDFGEIISIYLKIEWDIAKKGK